MARSPTRILYETPLTAVSLWVEGNLPSCWLVSWFHPFWNTRIVSPVAVCSLLCLFSVLHELRRNYIQKADANCCKDWEGFGVVTIRAVDAGCETSGLLSSVVIVFFVEARWSDKVQLFCSHKLNCVPAMYSWQGLKISVGRGFFSPSIEIYRKRCYSRHTRAL